MLAPTYSFVILTAANKIQNIFVFFAFPWGGGTAGEQRQMGRQTEIETAGQNKPHRNIQQTECTYRHSWFVEEELNYHEYDLLRAAEKICGFQLFSDNACLYCILYSE
jgi:hypothetical protein